MAVIQAITLNCRTPQEYTDSDLGYELEDGIA
jgi:hypothetical protein